MQAAEGVVAVRSKRTVIRVKCVRGDENRLRHGGPPRLHHHQAVSVKIG